MRAGILPSILLLSAAAAAGETTHLPLSEVVPWAGTIAVAEIDSVRLTETVDRMTVELEATALEVLVGGWDEGEQVSCSYTAVIPVIRDEIGEEVGTASIEVFGSGLEFGCARGDTAVLLLEPMVVDPGTPCGLVRLESFEARKRVLMLLMRANRID